jgi:hypothetical protein
MAKLQELSYADLDALHQQLTKEQGYATSDQRAVYAEHIAHVTKEKNDRLKDMFDGKLNSDISGNIVTAYHSDGVHHNEQADVSAEALKETPEDPKANAAGQA